MWLPTPVYERVPDFWILMGLLFFSLGLYIGFDYELIFAYLAVGLGCILRGMWCFITRWSFRSKKEQKQDEPKAAKHSDVKLDQTGATHV